MCTLFGQIKELIAKSVYFIYLINSVICYLYSQYILAHCLADYAILCLQTHCDNKVCQRPCMIAQTRVASKCIRGHKTVQSSRQWVK